MSIDPALARLALRTMRISRAQAVNVCPSSNLACRRTKHGELRTAVVGTLMKDKSIVFVLHQIGIQFTLVLAGSWTRKLKKSKP